jgi:chromosome segregation ATPase
MTSLDDTIENLFNSQRIQNVIIEKEETDDITYSDEYKILSENITPETPVKELPPTTYILIKPTLEAIREQRREEYKKKFSQLESAISEQDKKISKLNETNAKLNESNAKLNETISKLNTKISMLQSDIHYPLIITELLKRSR